jgi:hypothetical protein
MVSLSARFALVAPSLGSLVDAWGTGPGLPAIRAAAAGHDLEALYLVADLLVEGGVGKEHQAVQARVRMRILVG